MKVLVTGITGQLGYDAAKELARRGHSVIGTARRIPADLPRAEKAAGLETRDPAFAEMDLRDRKAVTETIHRLCPDAVIHCAAWTAVDAAEEPDNYREVYASNVLATRYLAEGCAAVNAKMLYISTDYVFDGHGTEPWSPDDAAFSPLNVYGKSKLEGEYEVVNHTDKYFIVRTAWVFGKNGKNFVKTILNAGRKYDSVRVVTDQIGTPTYTADLARLLADMIVTEKYGCYHATNEGGFISWYDFTKEIYRLAGVAAGIVPVTTAEYGLSKAARPFNSRMDKSKLARMGFAPLPDWKDALARYLNETGEL
ncbi:MAG: dTDP-4-dehydrorhamnose reductase [Clostridia bacterium]|nr:dTDP-4-dehydrorhamnose reductase [Clostridia bacterium]MBR6860305.1 dTDP-4-dehydrorhamnose reductase [Acidaminococcaceae bacterium]